MNNNKPIVIVSELIERFEKAIENGEIKGYLFDFVNFKFYYNLENDIKNITSSSDEEYKRIVLHNTFKMLDNANLINGDMRTIYEKEFA